MPIQTKLFQKMKVKTKSAKTRTFFRCIKVSKQTNRPLSASQAATKNNSFILRMQFQILVRSAKSAVVQSHPRRSEIEVSRWSNQWTDYRCKSARVRAATRWHLTIKTIKDLARLRTFTLLRASPHPSSFHADPKLRQPSPVRISKHSNRLHRHLTCIQTSNCLTRACRNGS